MALITFCIVHYQRLSCLKRCIDSIEKYTSVDYEMKILRQGYQGKETESYLESLEKKSNIEVIRLDRNVGPVKGKGMLMARANTPFTMILDNDIYVTKGWLDPVLEIFKSEDDVGVVSFPRYSLDGSLQHVGGEHLKIKNGVVRTVRITMLRGHKKFLEVNSTGSGAIVMRKEVRNAFHFDPRYFVGFGDLDKDVQLLNSKWKKVVCLESKVYHDSPRKDQDLDYLNLRYNWIEISRSYAKFREKWGLRYPLREHLQISLKVVEFPFIVMSRKIIRRFPVLENIKILKKISEL